MATYVTTHNVLHNDKAYPTGTEITLDETTKDGAATIAHLRANGAIALAVELQKAEDIQARFDANAAEAEQLRQDKAQLEAELERLRAAANAPVASTATSAAASGKAAKTAPAIADGEPPAAQS
jgi:hypothetical protein